jgi:hypothetical protein
MQLSDLAKSPPPAPTLLPPVAVTIEDGVATITLEPHTAELTSDVKVAVLGAERVRVFIDARTNANLSRPVCAPIKITDYAPDTLSFLVQHADLICAAIVDCRKDATPCEIEKIMSQFDGREAEDSRFVIRFFTDRPWDFGEYVELHRPKAKVRLASPSYNDDTEDEEA